jgi:acyl-CoA dehydrogenase family member 9
MVMASGFRVLGRPILLAPEAIEYVTHPGGYATDRARRELGWRPSTPLAEGLAAAWRRRAPCRDRSDRPSPDDARRSHDEHVRPRHRPHRRRRDEPTAPPSRRGCSSASCTRTWRPPTRRWPARNSARVADLVGRLYEITDELYDPKQVEQDRWVGDEVLREMGEAGLLGLWVDEAYGGQGLSQTGYCRVSEEFGRIDPTLAVVMGVHQSIGFKGIAMFGTEEQKERFLPDCAAGRKLAGFALTEPTTGSDAYNLDTRAELESDGSWRLNGEKRWIGNGNRDVVVTFARSEEHGHVALILTPDMEGFDSPFRYDTMGLRGNDLRHLTFNDVKVPPENVLGAPGEGFEIAMHVLNNGRMSLGTGSVGTVKKLIDLAIERVTTREQFGRPIGDFELVQEKISWMTSYLYGLEALCYLTTGMFDQGSRTSASSPPW